MAGVALSFEGSSDNYNIKAKDDDAGETTISGVFPTYAVQASWALSSRFGLRLKYKNQKAIFQSDEDSDIVGNDQSLHGIFVELPIQYSPHLQPFLRYRLQDRLLVKMDNINNDLELSKAPSNDFGIGFNWDTLPKPGFKFGYGAHVMAITIDDKSLSPLEAFEVGGSVKIGYQTRMDFGIFIKGQYSYSQFEAKENEYQVQELSTSLGLIFFF